MSDPRFAMFSFLLAFAAGTYSVNVNISWSLLPALFVLMRPSSVPRFLAFVAFQTALIFTQIPYVNTNITITFIVGLSILAAAIPVFASKGRGEGPVSGAALLDAVAPVLRAELLIIYVFTAFHKLNTGFLDPASSCGVAIYLQLQQALSWIPTPAPDLIATPLIHATFVIEGLLPLALVIPATRKLAIVAGMLFHFMLGLAWFFSFSATMMALLFLFSPNDIGYRAQQVWQERVQLDRRWLLAAAGAAAVAGLAVLAWFWEPGRSMAENYEDAVPFLKQLIALGWWLTLLPIAALAYVLLGTGEVQTLRSLLVPSRSWLWLLPLLTVFNGLNPYLGLKTETSFAMYSNLETEGGRSNHALIGDWLTIADYQNDLVEIVDSSDAWLAGKAERGHLVPFVSLRRQIFDLSAAGERNIGVTYIRDGERHSVDRAETDPLLSQAPNYLERKFLYFRPVRTDPVKRCHH